MDIKDLKKFNISEEDIESIRKQYLIFLEQQRELLVKWVKYEQDFESGMSDSSLSYAETNINRNKIIEDIRRNGISNKKEDKKQNYDFENYICIAEKKDDGTYSVKNINKKDFNEEEHFKLLEWADILPENPKISDVNEIFKQANKQVLNALDEMKTAIIEENKKESIKVEVAKEDSKEEIEIEEDSVVEIEKSSIENKNNSLEDLITKNSREVDEKTSDEFAVVIDSQKLNGDDLEDMYNDMESPQASEDVLGVKDNQDAVVLDKKVNKSTEYTQKFNEAISENNPIGVVVSDEPEEDLATLLQREAISDNTIPTIIIEPNDGFPVVASELNVEDVKSLTVEESNKISFLEHGKILDNMIEPESSPIFSPYNQQGYNNTIVALIENKNKEENEHVEDIEVKVENQHDNTFQSPIAP